MKTSLSYPLFILTALFLTATIYASSQVSLPVSHSSFSQGFEKNLGQIKGEQGAQVLYQHKTPGMSMFLLPTGIAYQFVKQGVANRENESTNELCQKLGIETPSITVETYRMDMQLVGANPNAVVTAHGESEGYVNHCNAEILSIHSYERIVYENIYPNIDWVIYENASGIKYDFIVKPNGDPSLIQFQAKWVEDLSIDESGNLFLKNRMGSVMEKAPVSFQNEEVVETNFLISDNVVSFNIAEYDVSKTLVIDPDLVWGTYYGGNGTDGLESIATDDLGNVYACGTTYGSEFLAEGGFQNTNLSLMGGIGAAYLVKFNSTGERIWATYYSGGDFTGGSSVAVDSEQNVYMTGFTRDPGLGLNGFQNGYNGLSDAYLVKFNPSGERLWATYLGGNEPETGRSVAVDNEDNVYVTGRTFSTNFPILNGNQETPGEGISLFGDAFLVKLDSSGGLIWSTFYGGSGADFAFSTACDNDGDIFIMGRTASADGIFINGHQSEYGGGQSDAFLAKYGSSGAMQWSTYYGGTGEDRGFSCATDNLGNVYITGETGSSNNMAFNGFQNSPANSYLAKFSATGEREWGTYYGAGLGEVGSGANVGYSCATDSENNVYMAGTTLSMNSIASDGFQNSYGGGSSDAYIVKFTATGDRVWGTYYGGSSNDLIKGMTVDAASTVYVAGITQSTNAIFFEGFQSSIENETGFVGKIGCPNPQLIDLPVELCAGESVELNPYPAGGALQLFGDGLLSGTTFTAPNTVQPATAILQYITEENGTCPGTITDFVIEVVPNTVASVNVTASNEEICEGASVDFIASIQNAGSSAGVEWFLNNELILEDSLTFTSSTLAHNDVVECVVESSNVCASPEVVQSNAIVLTVNPIPDVSLIFTSLGGGTLVADEGFSSYQWFLDGMVIDGASSPTLVPLVTGSYSVLVVNEFGCENYASTEVGTVSITEEYKALFAIYPNPTSGALFVDLGEVRSELTADLTNSLGQIIWVKQYEGVSRINLDLTVSTGVYFLKLTAAGEPSQTVKLLVE